MLSPCRRDREGPDEFKSSRERSLPPQILGGHPQQPAVGTVQKWIPSAGTGGSPGGNRVKETVGNVTSVTMAATAWSSASSCPALL